MSRHFVSFNAWDRPGKVYQAINPAEIFVGTLKDWPDLSARLQHWRQQAKPSATSNTSKAAALTESSTSSAKAFGYVGYDGTLWFGFYPEVILEGRHQDTRLWGEQAKTHSCSIDQPNQPIVGKVHSNWQPEGFIAAVQQAKEYILQGAVYQVNIAQILQASYRESEESTLSLFSSLLRHSPAPGMAYLDTGKKVLLSSSPELFLYIDGQRITTKPIKGTRRRGSNPAEDAALRHELISDPKERAELVMITDLERNDLGKICRFGSVEVSELLQLETYPQVHHLVSTVQGNLQAGITPEQAFLACFPGGSITGAPKKRACEIIAELEPTSRGLYTGALGWFGLDDASAAFSIIIRTAVVDRIAQTIHFGVGSGITIDSDPQAEYQETLHKARGWLKVLAEYAENSKS